MIRILVTGLGTLLALAGCSGGLGSSVTVSPDRYQPIQPAATAAIELPGTQGFAIHDKNSQQSPGQTGTATSSADAKPDGTAFCTASVGAGGSAEGAFALGAALQNESSAAMPVSVTCDIEYEYSLQATAASGGHKTAGTIGFAIEAREQGTGKLLFQHPLATLSGYEDNLKRSDQQRIQFVATVSRMARWQVVLQGSVQAQSGGDGKADTQLRVTRCGMTVKPLPAPASGPATGPVK